MRRTVAGDSEVAEAVKVLAPVQQRLVWDRRRHLNNLRSTLRYRKRGISQPAARGLLQERL